MTATRGVLFRSRGDVFRSPPGFGSFHEVTDAPVRERCPRPRTGDQWARLVARLEREVPERAFRLWLRPYLHPHRLRPDGVLELGWSGPGSASWVTRRYDGLIEVCAGRPVRIVLCDREER